MALDKSNGGANLRVEGQGYNGEKCKNPFSRISYVNQDQNDQGPILHIIECISPAEMLRFCNILSFCRISDIPRVTYLLFTQYRTFVRILLLTLVNGEVNARMKRAKVKVAGNENAKK